MPNLLAMMESTGQLQRAIIGRDAQQGTTQDFNNAISPSIPCSVQKASAQVTMLYKQRNSEVIYTVYMPTDPGAQVNDNFIVTDRLGNQKTLLVRDEAQQVDRDVIWVMTCAWLKSPQTATAQATKFLVSAPGTVTVGVPFNFTVTAENSVNQLVTGYGGTVAFYAFTDTEAALPSPSMLTSGVGTFSATFETLGTQTILAQDTVNYTINGTSGIILVGESSAPLPPDNLGVIALSGMNNLTWNSSVNATSYNVYRGLMSGGETLLVPGIVETSYADTDVVVNIEYFYEVTAVNAIGESAPSNEVSCIFGSSAGYPLGALPSPAQVNNGIGFMLGALGN